MHINDLSLESLPLVARHHRHGGSRPSVVGDLIDLRALRRITEATHDTLIYRAESGKAEELAALERAKQAKQAQQDEQKKKLQWQPERLPGFNAEA